MTDGYHGHMTMQDGSHVALTADQAKDLWAAMEASNQRRAEKLPDVETALRAMGEAYFRLQELGWRDATYCPKDGSPFEVIEAGSTGIHRAHYQGTWPNGTWWVEDEGDLYPSRPILFRLLPEAQAEYDAKMQAARERYAAERAAESAAPHSRTEPASPSPSHPSTGEPTL